MRRKSESFRKIEDNYQSAAVDFLTRNGNDVETTAAELGVAADELRTWQRKTAAPRDKNSKPMSPLARLRAENQALRDELRNMQVEWDILKTTLSMLSTTVGTHTG